jgi:uncharacterized membrane protein YqaE (UPF0057 family)
VSIWRGILCVLLPPMAVLDKGCGVAFLVGILWVFGWFPGVIAAIAINLMDSPSLRNPTPRFVQIPIPTQDTFNTEKAKRDSAYVRLADGEIAEIIDDDGKMPDVEKYKRGSSPP